MALAEHLAWEALVAGVDPPSILKLMHRPSWMRDALCREYPDVSFITDRGEPTEPAKAVCQRCLVAAECLDYAISLSEPTHGVWGGMSARERRKLRHSPALPNAA